MTDFVKSWCANVQGAEYGFFDAVIQALESFQAGDTNSLAKMLTISNGKVCKRIKRKEPERLPYAGALKRILSHVFYDLKATYVKDSDFGYTFEKGEEFSVSEEHIKALKMFRNKTIRDKGFKEAFPAINAKAKPVTAEKHCETMLKGTIKKLDDGALEELEALQAARMLVKALESRAAAQKLAEAI